MNNSAQGKTIDLKNMDPAVAAVLSHSDQKQKERKMPRINRKKLIKLREKAAARKDRRKGYDLDPDLTAEIAQRAKTLDTTESSVAQILLRAGLDAIHKGNLDLASYRQICEKNPRYLYTLEWHENE